MKPSNLQTPRTLADCTFTVGYSSGKPMAYRMSRLEYLAGYALAVVTGVAMAALLVVELSA